MEDGQVRTGPKHQAAQYLRMSHQRYSLGNQAALIGAYAAEAGYEIVRSYEDAGRSGVTTRRREGLKALLRDVLGGCAPFTHVLVVDVTRWGRFQDPDEAAHYEFICREAGVRVVYCGEHFADDLGGVIVKQIKRVMAGEYSRELSQKVQFGRRRTALSGRAAGGEPPFGFRRIVVNSDGSRGPILGAGDRKSRLDQGVKWIWGPPADIATLRLIFRLYALEGLTPTAIARRLNAEGRAWKRGGPWKDFNVVKALTNELAIGFMVFNKSAYLLGTRREVYGPEQWIRRRVCPPIISTKLFKRAQARRAELHGRARTDYEMLDALRDLLAREGRLSQKLIDASPGVANAHMYWRRFGSLPNAYRLIGYDVSDRRDARMTKQSREALLRGLKRLHDEEGGISSALIDADPRIPSAKAIRKSFGPLTVLYREIGIKKSRKGWRKRRAAVPR
jgi:DNA invertase Pin-like site-specific DNA recombinase